MKFMTENTLPQHEVLHDFMRKYSLPLHVTTPTKFMIQKTERMVECRFTTDKDIKSSRPTFYHMTKTWMHPSFWQAVSAFE